MNLRNMVGFDIESLPVISSTSLTAYENKLISKIENHSSYTAKTKSSKIEAIKQSILEFKSGIPNEMESKILKDFSVNPLMNKIVSIALVYNNYKNEETSLGIACESEKDIIKWFLNSLQNIQMELGGDIEFTGHCLQFDFNSTKLAMIRNELTSVNQIGLTRETLFPMSKYSNFVFDTSNVMGGTLDEIASAVLGESKINHGSQVYKMYKEGAFDKIRDYCVDDARKSFRLVHALHI